MIFIMKHKIPKIAIVLSLLVMILPLSIRAQPMYGDVSPSSDEFVGWEAVGRVDLPDGYCTGTLVASNLVLTAAHCLFDQKTGHSIPAYNIKFKAGFQNGLHRIERRVVYWSVPSSYTPTIAGDHGETMIASDLALLQLDNPVSPDEATPLKIHPDAPFGRKIYVISYGQAHAVALERHDSCDIIKRLRGGVLQFDCDVSGGSAGAPVLTRIDGGYRIVSLISIVQNPDSEEPMSTGMMLPSKLSDMYSAMRETALSSVASTSDADAETSEDGS